MANYQPQSPSLTGLNLTMNAAAGGGDSFDNNGSVLVRINNGSGGAITITADGPKADNFGITGDSHDLGISVPAGENRIWGPFPTNRFNDANGRVQLTYSGVTTLTIGFFYSAQAG